MISASEILEQLGQLLAGRMSLDAFEDWFVSIRQDIHKHADPEVKELAFAIDNVLSQFDEDSARLRQALLEAVFAAKEPSLFMNRYGDPSAIPESNAECAELMAS